MFMIICLWLYDKNDKKTTMNFILDKYFYSLCLWLYNFSKLMKIGVDLCSKNYSNQIAAIFS